ncbi:hypothetical protein CYY_003003 [Polysphondylium violaceum]|uniref:Uncharacterized protein n=1 Tax=Polysphondylium violaceum TaxID=133409 RepID=A0A8J4V0H8_9MYCE|nr:hypothetical protein CYY_003003 [Polysphondylium violaceum]
MIYFYNQVTANRAFYVSVNKWGDAGETTPYKVNRNTSETWDRSDTRGFIVNIGNTSDVDDVSNKAFLVFDGSTVFTKNNGIFLTSGGITQKLMDLPPVSTQ